MFCLFTCKFVAISAKILGNIDYSCRLCCKHLMIGKESTGSGISQLLLMKHLYMFRWYDACKILSFFYKSMNTPSPVLTHQARAKIISIIYGDKLSYSKESYRTSRKEKELKSLHPELYDIMRCCCVIVVNNLQRYMYSTWNHHF